MQVKILTINIDNLFASIRFPFGQRTSVTNELWAARGNLQKQEGKPVESRSPAESILDTTLPFSSNNELREQYLSPFGHIRQVFFKSIKYIYFI